MNLNAGHRSEPLRTGTTVDFEPNVTVGGQGCYLEDMFLITKDGSELMTPAMS
jgi:Xaa-Pro aminopeptidase